MPIDWLVLPAALASGLLGGLHCAAMCGGIATGLSATSVARGWAPALQLNIGRIGGYVAAGALVGALGHGLLAALRSPWLGIGLRMLVGAALVVIALRLFGVAGVGGFLARPGQRLWRWLQPLHRRVLPATTLPRRLVAGALWGWLPCGLSFSLLTVAWLQADPRNGALTMLAFGLGTLPVMLPLTWSGQRLGRWLQRPRLRGLAAGTVLALGLLTLAAPWLMLVPMLHGPLAALGCQPLPQ
ncbi:sulfite exporter TauE/SafE family protein [Luteimonas aestuarii]|uniref:Sulfite exporter TauE/SafE family protein n=1 Tax=Luteimonas aestuarii TaxID=453837 RepID=A0A4R5TV97_9GAMM|nr:sulfite exporter TauE/SafE family protein [Luteimonas aestuarii]TDK24970.1 sulfite exporter TauE/SafE family protein [Luteimonas aestuarii]